MDIPSQLCSAFTDLQLLFTHHPSIFPSGFEECYFWSILGFNRDVKMALCLGLHITEQVFRFPGSCALMKSRKIYNPLVHLF